MIGHKIEHTNALQFILAGKSIFTVKNPKTENRFTFKVNKHKEDDLYFIRVLTNPEFFEFIGTYTDKYKHSRKSRISEGSQSANVFDYITKNLSKGSLPDFLEIWHEGKCGRCGRRLTVPLSIETGFGPECSKLINH